MAVVKIEGKEITLPDDVVKAGEIAIRAVLAANGYPAVENSDIRIVGGDKPGAPAMVIVSPRSTGKGSRQALATARECVSVEEYLSMERASEERHEYIDGRIVAMAGESGAHADISTNLVAEVSVQLRGTPCRARSKDTKVLSGSTPRPGTTKGLFSYPDLVVICGEPQYHDEHQLVVLNPAVIIEVLSESTEGFDRGEKFHRYQDCNPTLSDYLLVSQTAPIVEHYTRQSDGTWGLPQIYEGLERSFTIESIACVLRLSDIYDRLTFELEPVEKAAEDRSS